VDTLEINLACEVPSVEVRAALGILEHACRGVELLDLESRLAALEAAEAARAKATENRR
jgi:hypothetical protein